MPMPTDVPIIDCMIGFPASDFSQYEFIRKQLKDSESRDGYDFPVEYMFKNVPKELYGTENPIDVTLHEMDRFGVEKGLIGCQGDVSQKALKDHPDRFIPCGNVDPNDGMEGIRQMVRDYEEWGVRAFGAFPAGCNPQVAIDGPGPTIWFQEKPEPKTVRNRVHLDLAGPSRAEEVERLQALGAKVRDEHDGFTVLLDPEGNEFCVVDADPS